MKWIRIVLTLSVLLPLTSLQAAAYKGQKIYMKSCKQCHGGGQTLATSKTQKEWEIMFKGSGAEFAEIHISSKDGEKLRPYFEGQRYKTDYKHIRDFFVEFASDSGNIPACN